MPSILGHPVLRREDPRLLTGQGALVANLVPLGVEGMGESDTVGATAAVQNAVIDALGHLGIRHLDIPTSPQRVWKALQNHV